MNNIHPIMKQAIQPFLPKQYECDVCGELSDDVTTIKAYGLDTDACDKCRNKSILNNRREE